VRVFREAVLGILAAIAKQERIRISERPRAGLDRAREKGTRTGRPIGRPRMVFHRDQVNRVHTASLNLISSFGACARSCFVPRYRSVICTDECPSSRSSRSRRAAKGISTSAPTSHLSKISSLFNRAG
jgi:hypothetical protein